ncbi:MAG: AbrB/MazE/SpoVT family DNA-binding domain-containing protein [Lactobacillus sp.]|jgi:AbrB family looped-hinge helix DNA binding protein|nr:AbrB/MazE/SpoVT family DNA-binding domain-containing protein [Lactobacillus sp.]
MAEKRTVGQLNTTLYVPIPADIAAKLNIKKGTELIFQEKNGAIIVKPTGINPDKRLNQIEALMARYADAMTYLADK